ncbi:hypothetical protein C8A01DRAFT_41697 [Parachaetomium inaequale]|uniref:Uncharacterized protein n=1 Tax=Parachaetomium inaequale TaxID=2588326 RepID=A0AAN6SLM5_9PEZI|nr:hypothetical protein C8A01DRAFT_41697 [Parachaetomium inaequale]
MAGLSLVPIPIAVPLIILTTALLPLTPIAWVWITLTGVSRGIRRREHPGQTAKAIGRWIGLSIALPWAALIALALMVVAQLLLAPLVLLHQLRALGETITWLSTQLGIASNLPVTAAFTDNTPVDVSSLPRYTFTPLPSSPNSLRLLTIHPGPFPSPLRGTLTTTTLSSSPTYDALSYTWASPTSSPSTNTPPPQKTHTLLCLTPPPPAANPGPPSP